MPKDVFLSATNMFIDTFIAHLESELRYSAHTVRAYSRDLQDFKEYIGGVEESLTLTQVDTDLVRGWAAMLIDNGKSASTVNRKLSALRTFYDFMRSEGNVPENPVFDFKGPKRRMMLPTFLKEEEINAVIDDGGFSDDFSGVRNRAVIICFYETGIRLSELVGLNVSDIDFGKGTLKVFGKRGRERIVPLVGELQLVLADYINIRSTVVPMKENALFVSSKGVRISTSQVYRLVNRSLLGKTHLNKRSPHVLRHTFATAMLNNDAELSAVKELLGHKRLTTTEIYTHLTFEELKRYYKKAHPRAGK